MIAQWERAESGMTASSGESPPSEDVVVFAKARGEA